MDFLSKLGNKGSEAKLIFMTEPYLKSILMEDSFVKISSLPSGVDENEWLASNTKDFLNYVGQFYGTIIEECTPQSCPCMNAGPTKYQWTDSQRKSFKVPAPQYVDYVLSYIQGVITDKNQFPTTAGFLILIRCGIPTRL
jgi:hypothetical protein